MIFYSEAPTLGHRYKTKRTAPKKCIMLKKEKGKIHTHMHTFNSAAVMPQSNSHNPRSGNAKLSSLIVDSAGKIQLFYDQRLLSEAN